MDEIARFVQKHKFPRFDLKAVFFDMDGVLFDSMKYHAYAWVKAMRASGIPFTEYDCYMNEGRTGESTINEFSIKYRGHEATEAEIESIYSLKSRYFESCPAVEPIPAVLPLLKKIKEQGLDIFIVTGSAQKSLLSRLNHYFPNIFEKNKMITAFDVKRGKPDPEPYLIALKKAQLEPWQALVIENAPLGVQSAVGAKILTIAVNTGILEDKVLADAGAEVVFPNMNTLLKHWNDFYE